MTKVLVTGASGFVGQHLCGHLARAGFVVEGTSRSAHQDDGSGTVRFHQTGDLGDQVDWMPILQGVDCVVHLAARVHVMRETVDDPVAEFRRVNVRGTEQLALAAAAAGVRRFIFLSSIKVNGESTSNGAFRHDDVPSPTDPYAVSKLEAENTVKRIGNEAAMECVIFRPPLIYGAGVGGNVLRAMKLLSYGIPLPLGSIRNRRSMLAVDNLCDAIEKGIVEEAAAGQCFLLADGVDLSTPEFFGMLARLLGVRNRILRFPPSLLALAGAITGHSAEVARLRESLQVDIEHARAVLGWTPRVSPEQGLVPVIDGFRAQREGQHD